MKPVAEMSRLELAAFISNTFKNHNIDIVLSGGSCVSISRKLDMFLEIKQKFLDHK